MFRRESKLMVELTIWQALLSAFIVARPLPSPPLMLRTPIRINLAPALLLFVLTTAALFLSPPAASAAESPKKVLIFSSEEQQSPAILILNQSIRSTLKNGLPVHFQFFYEAQDNFRISNEKYEEELVRLLQRKYDGEHFDLIYAIGPPALNFLLKHQSELFTDTPVIYLVTDTRRVADLDLESNVTGVGGKLELAPTLDIALDLQPQTQRVVVVAGNAPADTAIVELARQEFRPYEGKVEFTYLINLPIEELQKRLAGLPEKTIVFYLSVNTDPATRIYTSPEVLSQLAPSSSAPIYGPSQTYIGYGTIGGRLINFEEIGTRAAEIGMRILAGESPRSIPPQTMPPTTMFDWRELQRWGIPEDRLPTGAIVKFKELSFWEQYKWRIIAIFALCVVEALIIGVLLANRDKRRQAERETERFASLVKAEHQRLEDIVTNVPGIVWEMRGEPGTASQSMEFVSGYIQEVVGYRADEWLSAPDLWFTSLHEDDREWVPREIAKIFASGKGGALQCRYRAKDGRVVWVAVNILVTCNEVGEPVALRGVTMDITERKDAEEALRESETRFRQMADTSEIFIWIADTEMRCTYFNQRILDFTGRNMDELRGEGWLNIIHEDDRQRCVDAYAAGYERREPFILEFRIRRADGQYRWIYDTGSPRLASSGEFLGYIGSAVDIHDRKQAEAMLRKIAEGVSSTDGELLGSLARRLSEVLNVDFVSVLRVTGENHDRVSTLVALIDGEIAENIEYCLENTPCDSVLKLGQLSCASGVQSQFPLDQELVEMGVESYLGISLRNSTGQPFGLVSVMSRAPIKNIETHESLLQIFASRAAAEMERQQAEWAFQQSQAELAHVARVMITGELAATIAHEVNQPLTAMVANANATRRMLGNGNANLDEAREAIDDIINDAHRASQIVGRIRSLLRKEPRRTEPLAINEVIEEVVVIARNELVGKKVMLKMDLADGLPKVEADRVEIQQVMLNLMMNAVEAMRGVEDGGRKLVMRTAKGESGGALIEVQDSGIGIASENLERIFEAFYTTRQEGMGMGLSICRTIVEAHGGKLWAESNNDRGATFRFTLRTATVAETKRGFGA